MPELLFANTAAITRQRKGTGFKKLIIASCTLIFLLAVNLKSQDLPLINPALTNSFFYNPSLAGSSIGSLGSASIIHRESFMDISGHPVCDILSVEIAVHKYRFGMGANFFIDRVNALQTTYGSFSYAFHIPFDRYKKLSLGVSGSLAQQRLDYSKVQVEDNNELDLIINEYAEGKFKVDFSVGVNYQVKRLTLGGVQLAIWHHQAFLTKKKAYHCLIITHYI